MIAPPPPAAARRQSRGQIARPPPAAKIASILQLWWAKGPVLSWFDRHHKCKIDGLA
jgi:hypothetical protein